ncbi:hypothetical protein [Paenibacillus sp. MMO-177]|uniref:hypothetical protein n=1 Tax=Paenibacillus sp. MMO-177 TaxID=3081289 RepID=UPI00301894BA
MPKLNKAQLEEVSSMKPYALCVTASHQTVEVVCINHFDFDEVIVRVDGGEPRKYKIQEERGNGGDISTDYGRQFWMDGNRRKYYLDECVRYGSAWLPV